ncbi:aminotransferase class I/II-fold pyridoxal phosphate-dependent enzyme [Deinococcus psychrotolerans]|uniref:Aminotransferase class I/II-fold pyridoxal phosphate-dependent enzyme n=1 Tax=Deinococcus psychrotolerans TaxID=2489213 RepID=A0A3G8YPF5_9DEIO|nr:aminotransferase class I/II-fold pyridoxal phosphate-dependent enzyme [Deinococcus psychrotolerans]AZI43056.1 aminotransferase class I/II-fold pyridoxal phosphate-dependent enzyme [Deinococcus psychrotolerans]
MTVSPQTLTWTSQRAANVPASVFALMDAAKMRALAAGKSLIDLSIGSSDLAPPEAALEALRRATRDPLTYRYPLFSDTAPLRTAAAAYLQRRYGLSLDPDTEILPLIGAQEGLAHLLLAVTDPGDTLLLPDPCYPPYYGAAAVAGLKTYPLPLTAERRFLPDLAAVPETLRPRALLLNYPNNPTSATVPTSFFEEVRAWCADRGTLLIHDHPYAELTYGDYRAPSALSGGAAGVVELHSLSKTHHMGGFRVGFAAGDAGALAALARVKGAVDFHPYLGIQAAAVAALGTPPSGLDVFEARRDALVPALHALGWQAEWPQASMYVWARPVGLMDSVAYALRAAEETGVALAPGRAFGSEGEGYLRFALVQPPEVLQEAAGRLSGVAAS